MSIPQTKPGAGPGIILVTGHKGSSHINSQTLERPDRQPRTVIVQGSHTLGKVKKVKPSQRNSAGNIDYDNISTEADEPPMFRSRSKTVGDTVDPPKRSDHHHHDRIEAGIKSEGEEDSQTGTIKPKSGLGKTPNHLTLSTTSTLSAGSTGSQARLIQSSHAPENFHPMHTEELGKQHVQTVKAEVHIVKTRSPQRQISDTKKDTTKSGGIIKKDPSPNQSRKTTPNHSRKSSPNQSRKSSPNKKRSDSISPKNSRKSSPKTPRRSRDSSPKAENGYKSPKKIKSSLKQPTKSLSIETPTCVECYLSGKAEKPG
ncbi:unnamed protein product [Diabrotica balteata]|uniref:Uncharacterized protein n=1 Tax=Diabrotica balteata TaxID=107213 RepID=A0A9N9XEG8_DIABA|nr:unnamed protein product [Diabrotica balteata]